MRRAWIILIGRWAATAGAAARVDQRLAGYRRDPAKGVGMFAYTFYKRPPVKIQALEPNLYLSFVYQCAAHRDPDNLQEWRASVEGWQKLGGKLVAREGWGNHYYLDLPFVHHEWIIKNLAEAFR